MKDDRVYLQNIQGALNDIANCGSDREGFFSDRNATLRKLEVIGQPVKSEC